jgi:hypothetical protein
MEETKTGSKKALIFGFLILLMVGYIVYNKQVEEPFSADVSVDTQEVTDETLPSYIVVEELDSGDKLVKHVRDGYEVVVGEEIELVEIENALVIEPKEFKGLVPGCQVEIDRQEGTLDNIEIESKKICDLTEGCTDYQITNLDYNSNSWKKIVFLGEYLGSGIPQYKLELDKNIVTIYAKCNENTLGKDILNNFALLK